MSEELIPAGVRIAARRAFIRTTAQAYAASLTVGLLTSVVSLLVDYGQWLTVIVAVLLAIVSPLLAGLVAYFQWIAKGIPEDYTTAVEEEQHDAQP